MATPSSIFTQGLNLVKPNVSSHAESVATAMKLHVNSSGNLELTKNSNQTRMMEYKDEFSLSVTSHNIMDVPEQHFKSSYTNQAKNNQGELFIATYGYAISGSNNSSSYTFLDGQSTTPIPKAPQDMCVLIKYDESNNMKWHLKNFVKYSPDAVLKADPVKPPQYQHIELMPDTKGGVIASSLVSLSGMKVTPTNTNIIVVDAFGNENFVPLPSFKEWTTTGIAPYSYTNTSYPNIGLTVHYDENGLFKYAFTTETYMNDTGITRSACQQDNGDIIMTIGHCLDISYYHNGALRFIDLSKLTNYLSNDIHLHILKITPDFHIHKLYTIQRDSYAVFNNISSAPGGGFVLNLYNQNAYDLRIYDDADVLVHTIRHANTQGTQFVLKFDSRYLMQWCTRIGIGSWSTVFQSAIFAIDDGYVAQLFCMYLQSDITMHYQDGTSEIVPIKLIKHPDGTLHANTACIKLDLAGRFQWNVHYVVDHKGYPYDTSHPPACIAKDNLLMTWTVFEGTPMSVLIEIFSAKDGSKLKTIQFNLDYNDDLVDDDLRTIPNSFSLLERYTDPQNLPISQITIPGLLEETKTITAPYNFMRVIDFNVVHERYVDFGSATTIKADSLIGTIPPSSILDNTITPSKIPDHSLTFSKLDLQEVTQINTSVQQQPLLPRVATGIQEIIRLGDARCDEIHTCASTKFSDMVVSTHIRKFAGDSNAPIFFTKGDTYVNAGASTSSEIVHTCVFAPDGTVVASSQIRDPYVMGIENGNINILPGVTLFPKADNKYSAELTFETPLVTPTFSNTITFRGSSNEVSVPYHSAVDTLDSGIVRYIFNEASGELTGLLNVCASGIRAGSMASFGDQHDSMIAHTYIHNSPSHLNIRITDQFHSTTTTLPNTTTLAHSCLFGTTAEYVLEGTTTKFMKHTADQTFFVTTSSPTIPTASSSNNIHFTPSSSKPHHATFLAPFVFANTQGSNNNATIEHWVASSSNIPTLCASNITEVHDAQFPYMAMLTINNITCPLDKTLSYKHPTIPRIELAWNAYIRTDLSDPADLLDHEMIMDAEDAYAHLATTQGIKIVDALGATYQVGNPNPAKLATFVAAFSPAGTLRWARCFAPYIPPSVRGAKLHDYTSSHLAILASNAVLIVSKEDGSQLGSIPNTSSSYIQYGFPSPTTILAYNRESTSTVPNLMYTSTRTPNGVALLTTSANPTQTTQLLVQAPLIATADIATSETVLASTGKFAALQTDELNAKMANLTSTTLTGTTTFSNNIIIDKSIDTPSSSNIISLTQTNTLVPSLTKVREPIRALQLNYISENIFSFDWMYTDTFKTDSNGNMYALTTDSSLIELDGTVSAMQPSILGSLYVVKYSSHQIISMTQLPVDVEIISMKDVDGFGMCILAVMDNGTVLFQSANLTWQFTTDFSVVSAWLKPDGSITIIYLTSSGTINIPNADGTSTISFSGFLPTTSTPILTEYNIHGVCNRAFSIRGLTGEPIHYNIMLHGNDTYFLSQNSGRDLFVQNPQGQLLDVVTVTSLPSGRVPRNIYLFRHTSSGKLKTFMVTRNPAQQQVYPVAMTVDSFGNIYVQVVCAKSNISNPSAPFFVNRGDGTELEYSNVLVSTNLCLVIKYNSEFIFQWVLQCDNFATIDRLHLVDDNEFFLSVTPREYREDAIITGSDGQNVKISQASCGILRVDTMSGVIRGLTQFPTDSWSTSVRSVWKDPSTNHLMIALVNDIYEEVPTSEKTYSSFYSDPGAKTITATANDLIIEFRDEIDYSSYKLPGTSIKEGTTKRLINANQMFTTNVDTINSHGATLSTFSISQNSSKTLMYAQSNWVSLSQTIYTSDIVDQAVTSSKLTTNLTLTKPTITDPALINPQLINLTLQGTTLDKSIDTATSSNLPLLTNTTILAPTQNAGKPITAHTLASNGTVSSNLVVAHNEKDGSIFEHTMQGGTLLNMDGTPSRFTNTPVGHKIIKYDANGNLTGFINLSADTIYVAMRYIPSIGMMIVADQWFSFAIFHDLTQVWLIQKQSLGINIISNDYRKPVIRPDGSFVIMFKAYLQASVPFAMPNSIAIPITSNNPLYASMVSITSPVTAEFMVVASYTASGNCKWASFIENKYGVYFSDNSIVYNSRSPDTYVYIQNYASATFKIYNYGNTLAGTYSTTPGKVNLHVLKFNDSGMYVGKYSPFLNDGYDDNTNSVSMTKLIVDAYDNIYMEFSLPMLAGAVSIPLNAGIGSTKTISVPANTYGVNTMTECVIKLSPIMTVEWGLFFPGFINLGGAFHTIDALFVVLNIDGTMLPQNFPSLVLRGTDNIPFALSNNMPHQFPIVKIDAQGRIQGYTQYPNVQRAFIRNIWKRRNSVYIAATLSELGSSSVPAYTYGSYYNHTPATLTSNKNAVIIEYVEKELPRFKLHSSDVKEGFIKRLVNPEYDAVVIDVHNPSGSTATVTVPQTSATSLIYSGSNWHVIDSHMATIGSNLTLQGVTVAHSNIIPYSDLQVDLGDPSHRFRNGYFSSVYAPSDARIKTALSPIADPLDKIATLAGFTYTYCNDRDGPRHAGLIAQDVQRVLPEAVLTPTNPSDTLSINYSAMIPLLVEGMKSLMHQNQELAGKYEELLMLTRIDKP